MSKGMSWSDLPKDVLQIICDQKLSDAKDYVRFGAVCTSWRSAVWLSRYQVPVLMFLNSSEEHTFNPYKTKYTHTFFSIREDLHVPILPVTSDEYIRNWVGSDHGWLLIEKYCTLDDMLQLHLWNPFLSIDIKLPSLQGDLIVKSSLSNNPIWKSDYAVMVIYYLNYLDVYPRLALFKTGDKSWTYIGNHDEHGSSLLVIDVIFYKHQFYVLFYSELMSCDITPRKPKLTRVASLPLLQYSYSYSLWCLVESSGDLLCVLRKVEPVENCFLYSTVGFRIFKVLTNKESHFMELKTLRGHTLFLGDHTSLSLLSSDFHQCKSNHIYFAYRYGVNGKHDEGVFNLEDSSCKPLYSGNMINVSLHQPVWVQPTLNITKDSASSSKLHMGVVNLEDTSLQPPFSENVNEQLTNPNLVQPPMTTDSASQELNVGEFNLEDTNLQLEQLTNPILVQPSTSLNLTTDSASRELNVGVLNLEDANHLQPEQLTNPILVQPATSLNMTKDYSASHELNVVLSNLEDASLHPPFSENVHKQLTNPILVQLPTVNMTMQIPKSASGSTNKRLYHHIRKLLNCLGCLSNVQRVVV